MAGEPTITFTGRLVRDPELHHTPSGAAVANFAVAVTPRNKNPHTDNWEDGTPLFIDCAAWRTYAENIAATYTKGTHVWVQGRLVDDSYERDGQTIRRWKVDVEETGPALRFTTAPPQRTTNPGASSPPRPPDHWQQPQRPTPPSAGRTSPTFDPPF